MFRWRMDPNGSGYWSVEGRCTEASGCIKGGKIVKCLSPQFWYPDKLSRKYIAVNDKLFGKCMKMGAPFDRNIIKLSWNLYFLLILSWNSLPLRTMNCMYIFVEIYEAGLTFSIICLPLRLSGGSVRSWGVNKELFSNSWGDFLFRN